VAELRKPAASVLALVLGLSAGCAHESRGGRPPDSPLVQTLDAEQADRIHLDLIERLLRGERPYAALAHLDALPADELGTPRARWLRAECQRAIGDSEAAEALYRDLLGGPYAGLAERGLGLLAAGAGDANGALAHLRAARALLPTHGRIRNDLGYAWLLEGSLEAARTELLTAAELDPDEPTVAANVLLLLTLLGDEPGAAAWARARKLSEGSVEDVRSEAARLRASWAARPSRPATQVPGNLAEELEKARTTEPGEAAGSAPPTPTTDPREETPR